jgi:hypothetical protein
MVMWKIFPYLLTQVLISARKQSSFPRKVIGAYASWNECDDKIIDAVKDGANVIFWFAINLVKSPHTGLPMVETGLDFNCVANKTKAIKAINPDVVHMISVGGWNSPHPDTSNSVKDIYLNWKHWNEKIVARPELGFYGFDGIDWDIEGNDNVTSEYNYFTKDCLDLIGEFSLLARRDNYFVSIAPAQSYLDSSISSFDRYANHTDPQWDPIVPNFAYHGHNVYAYILAKYGSFYRDFADNRDVSVQSDSEPTFNMVSIQLYEGYSHAYYNTTQMQQPFHNYLIKFVEQVSDKGWFVDFQSDEDVGIPSQKISVPSSQLVIGLANAWAQSSEKFLFVNMTEVQLAYDILLERNNSPLGFMYWDIGDDGIIVNGSPFNMSYELNQIMHLTDGKYRFAQIDSKV